VGGGFTGNSDGKYTRAHRHTGGVALTGHLGGDALRRPEHSAALFSKHGVTVGVGVDKAGADDLACCIDNLGGRLIPLGYHDFAVLYAHTSFVAGSPAAVNGGTVDIYILSF